MKKNWMKLLALALSVVMVLGLFAGCDLASIFDKEKEKEEGGIVGKWEGTLDFADYYNQTIAAQGDDTLVEMLSIDSLEFVICFNFDEDGTCEMYLDEAALERTMEDLKGKLIDGMRAYLEAQLEGTGITLEDALASQNTDLETLVNQSLNFESLFNSTQLKQSGTYKYEDDKLYIADEGEDIEDEEEYAICKIKGNKMTLTADDETLEADNFLASVLPLTFTRK